MLVGIILQPFPWKDDLILNRHCHKQSYRVFATSKMAKSLLDNSPKDPNAISGVVEEIN